MKNSREKRLRGSSNKIPLHILAFLTTAVLLASNRHHYLFARADSSSSATDSLQPPPPAYECNSIDIRNECDNLNQLANCTVIRGFLRIVLLPKPNMNKSENCNFTLYRFPKLREITGYLIFFDVQGLTTIRDMLPSLTVIRGKNLFLNYAMGLTHMPDLEVLEFRSLVAIQRGHVFIGSSPKLHNLEKVHWNRLTLSSGENHIFPIAQEDSSPPNVTCQKCPTKYCWSDEVCQKFENDNVLDPGKGTHDCHDECLGGCYNGTSEGCVVCRHLTDHGSCVASCTTDKYLADPYGRCYTQQECVHELGWYTYGFSCVFECPGGTQADNTSDCVRNASLSNKTCHPPHEDDPLYIYNLSDADRLRGCQIINGSLEITIKNKINEIELVHCLGDLREIRGLLKIYRSPHLTSLRFLSNLTRISGHPLENDKFALMIYENKNLEKLWNASQTQLEHGGMYIQMNNKLCNRHLRTFSRQLVHDKALDLLQTSDQEVLCEPSKLQVQFEIISHSALRLTWGKDQTADEVEIIYRLIPPGEVVGERSELDSNVCTRINWQRNLLLASELEQNGTSYSYTIKDLQPNARYGCLVKTFSTNDLKNARSELEFVTTKMDIPSPPKFKVTKKTESSLTLKITPRNTSKEVIDYYILELYEFPDDVHQLDQRDYCAHPAYTLKDMPLESYQLSNYNEDYDECCSRQEEAQQDRLFTRNMYATHSCSLDRKDNCGSNTNFVQLKPLLSLRLEHNETTHTLQQLEHFRLYVLQLHACNQAGCGSFSMHSERTNYSTTADKLDNLHACHLPAAQEYHVYFDEPQHPNSLIVSYVIHYRIYMPHLDEFQGHLNCVTRLEHAEANYHYVAHLKATYTQVAVRVHSLAGDFFSDWFNLTLCQPLTKVAGISMSPAHSHGLNIFLIFFLIGAGGTVLWICYKRRYWRKLLEIRRYLPLHYNWRTFVPRSDALVEDREILVDGFESVRFQRNDDQLFVN